MSVRSSVQVFADMMSQPSRAVIMFCKEAGIPHEVSLVQIAKGEHLSDEFKAINPLNQVPAIKHEGHVITESHTILRYLHSVYGAADHWYPSNPLARTRVDRYLDWHHGNLRRGSAGVVFNKFLAPKIGLKADPPEAIVNHEKVLHKSLKTMNGWLGEAPFLAGERISIADLAAICELDQTKLMALPWDKYPNIIRWHGDVCKEVKSYDEVCKILNMVTKSMSKM